MRCTRSVSNNTPPLYGDAFADVYDEWYEHVTDAPATARALHALAGGGNLLELGIGTGRIAIPLAQLLAPGRSVWGIDESQAMLDLCRAKLGDMNPSVAERIHLLQGDMADDLPSGPFSVIFCTFNTFFNLDSEAAQRKCLHAIAQRLAPGGAVVLETAVLTGANTSAPTIAHTAHSSSDYDPETQIGHGVFTSASLDGSLVERPWRIRYSTPVQIDEMAAAAGLICTDRWEDFAFTPFHAGSARQVAVWRRRI